MAANTQVEQVVKPETLNYAVVGVQVKTGTDAEGNPTYKMEPKAITNEKEINTAREKGTILFEQTVSYDLAGTVDGFEQVIKDPEERVLVFNAGVRSSRINPRVKKVLEEVDENNNLVFQPVEGSYDIRDIINEPAQRRFLSDMEKAKKVLDGLNLTPEQIAQIMASYAQQPSPEAEEATA